MRALFFNEGNLDTHVFGHAQLDAVVRAGWGETDELDVRFAGLAPLSGCAHALAHRRIRLLRKIDFDFVVLRWHLVQSHRARRALRGELARWPANVVHLYTPAVALTMGGVMRTTPVVLSTGATVRDWWAMPEAGVLIDHGDRHALREALRTLVRDPDRRRQLGVAARRRAEQHYDARRQFAALAGRLREAVALHREATPGGVQPRQPATSPTA